MSFASNYAAVTNKLSSQINPVDIRYWAFLPAAIGLLLCLLIIAVWRPAFSGTYNYRQCQGKNKTNCVDKVGNIGKRNMFIILIMFFLFPSMFAGIGYKIGFALANPKITAGIFAVDAVFD